MQRRRELQGASKERQKDKFNYIRTHRSGFWRGRIFGVSAAMRLVPMALWLVVHMVIYGNNRYKVVITP